MVDFCIIYTVKSILLCKLYKRIYNVVHLCFIWIKPKDDKKCGWNNPIITQCCTSRANQDWYYLNHCNLNKWNKTIQRLRRRVVVWSHGGSCKYTLPSKRSGVGYLQGWKRRRQSIHFWRGIRDRLSSSLHDSPFSAWCPLCSLSGSQTVRCANVSRWEKCKCND